ncbi:MAG TPA: oligosaccharide flippase family protein [Gaiellaceae bacterium]
MTRADGAEGPRDESIGLARSSALILGSTLVGNAGYFLSVLLLARLLGASGRGSMAFVVVSALFLGRVAALGLGEATTVFVAQRETVRRELLTNAIVFTALSGLVVAVAFVATMALAHGLRPNGVDNAELIALGAGIVATSIAEGTGGFLRGLGRFRTLAIVGGVAPWIYLLLLVGFELGRPDLTVTVAAIAWAVHTWVEVIWGVVASSRATGFGRVVGSLARGAIGFGARAWFGTLAGFLNARADQLLMAFIASEVALGVYAVAVNASETLLYLPASVGLALLPRISAIAAPERVQTTLLVFRRLLLVTSAAGVVAAVVGPPLIPRLFGDHFHDSVTPFLLLIPGALGYTGLTVFTNALAATAAPGRSSLASLVTLVTGVTLDLLLIPPFGASGAAFAATAAFVTGGATAIVLFRLREPFPLGEMLPRPGDVRALVRLARDATGRFARRPA